VVLALADDQQRSPFRKSSFVGEWRWKFAKPAS
jgi:hypothetical protein